MRRLLSWCFLLAYLIYPALVSAAAIEFVYPRPVNEFDKRYEYYWSLLRAILESNKQTYGSYVLSASVDPMTTSRALAVFKSHGEVNILARTTSEQLEAESLPIRIPLDKGLTGYRVMLIDRSQQEKFNQIRQLSDLKSIRIGQDASWPDVSILQNAGLTVVTGNNYQGLFAMLKAGRFDAFSRGINEVQDELHQQQTDFPSLAIEQHVLLYYPLPRYFFVPNNAAGQAMKARIEDGLQRLIRSGEFEKRYRAYKKEVLSGLSLKNRLIIRISNPLLSKETPLNNVKLWDDLTN